MRLLSLDVKHFCCVKQARVEFARGLTVLYGPNDIGKSTLLQAIRAGLLLPHTSSASKAFIPWQEPSAVPEVELTFEIVEGGSPRFYRLKKAFGQSAHLDFSNDGSTFSHDKSAREVDERLRQLLRLGVPAAGAGRGMPESFLVKVLMASQPEVTAILGAALGEDKDPSGKQHIMGAMEAMMEDPLWKRVLDRTLRRVSEGFSATGQRRKGKDSPWVLVRDQLNLADEGVTKLRTLREQSVTVTARLQALDDDVVECEAAVEAAKRRFTECAVLRDRQRQLHVLREQLSVAELNLNAELAKLVALEHARKEEQRLLVATEQAEVAEAERREVVDSARATLAAATERVRELASADAAREVLLRTSQLKERQTKLQLDIDAKKREGELAQAVGVRHREHGAQQVRVTELEKVAGVHEVEVERLRRDVEAATEAVQRGEQLSRFWRHRDLSQQLEQAEIAAKACDSHTQEAARLREQAKALEINLATRELPPPKLLANLQTLQRELEVKQAALDLGWTAVVTPSESPLELEVTLDDGAPRRESLFAAATFTGRQSVKLSVPGASIALNVGARDSVQALAVLREKWRAESEPVLRAANVASISELEAAVAAAHAQREEVVRLRRSAGEKEAAAKELAAQVARRETLRPEVLSSRDALAELDLAALEERVRAFRSETELSQSQSAAQQRLRALEMTKVSAREAFHTTSAQLEAARSQLSAADTAYREAAGRLAGDWQTKANELADVLKLLQAEKAEVDVALSQLTVGQNEQLDSARAHAEAWKVALDAATAALEEQQQRLRIRQRELAEHRGKLGLLNDAARGADVKGAELAVATARDAFTALETLCLPAGPPLEQVDLDIAKAAVEQAEVALGDKRRERDEARGGLMQVGGDVVEEELNEAMEALALRKGEFEDLEVEFGAWQLLETTLREAERAESTNLGEVLGSSLQSRFEQLTGGRYTRVGIDHDLKTKGFVAAGELRDVGALSAGTQEQLSTLFRLCLAEALGTAVILDDHLSQTDSQKMRWFRAALDEIANKSQVIVISCWPEHYQLPPNVVDTARKIDAAQVVERY
jgi:hypothetical protein